MVGLADQGADEKIIIWIVVELQLDAPLGGPFDGGLAHGGIGTENFQKAPDPFPMPGLREVFRKMRAQTIDESGECRNGLVSHGSLAVA